jgi:AcrR family transcriptional regulator
MPWGMKRQATTKTAPIRGPAEHSVRDQIVKAAHEYFAHYGFAKTTVSDLAREIGFSKAYIYRFFESKQAIGEAIVCECLDEIFTKVYEAVESGRDANDKLRRFARTVTTATMDVAFNDRKIYEVATHASSENWAPVQVYTERLQALLEDILKEGRESGQFERKTPIDETRRAIYYALLPFMDPVFLQRSIHLLPDAQTEIINLILRSLAP